MVSSIGPVESSAQLLIDKIHYLGKVDIQRKVLTAESVAMNIWWKWMKVKGLSALGILIFSFLFQPVPFVHHQSVLLPGHCEVHWDLQHLQQMVSPLFDWSKSPFRIYDIFCSDNITYSVQNIKKILNTTYDIYWAEYIIYCAHLVGILDLWDLSDGKGEGKVHLLLPRRLVCKSQIEIPNAKNKPYFLKKESTHRGRVAWWPRSPWVYTKEPSRDPGSSARAASRHKITAWIHILHSLQSLVCSQNWCLPKQRKYDLQRTSANF